MSVTDVELSRAVNALSTTLRDQRPQSLDAPRCQQIVDGALGGERKLTVRRDGEARGSLTGPDGTVLASVERRDGQWHAAREVDAKGSRVAVPGGGT